MRPKKQVLIVSADEAASSVRRFALAIRGYNAFVVTTPAEALEFVRQYVVDGVVIDLALGDTCGNSLARKMKATKVVPFVMLLAQGKRTTTVTHQADVLLYEADGVNALHERLRGGTARKRGPKKIDVLESMEAAAHA